MFSPICFTIFSTNVSWFEQFKKEIIINISQKKIVDSEFEIGETV
jgi:hypothetical protein